MTRYLLVGIGTRGDVQPLVALAEGMIRAGLDVTIVAGTDFQQWVEGRGIPFKSLPVDVQAMMNSKTGIEWVNNSKNPIQEGRNMRLMFREYGLDVWRELVNVCLDA
ncbi:MAG TPA: glycosyltransferase, partial [Aggregatilineales bacterium]|nr:glycosyltransferase [Aggregatilineales bacterium]